MSVGSLLERVEDCIRRWDLEVEDRRETAGSLLVFGRRRERPVVLKVIREPGDEWNSGEVLEAFGGKGVVGVREHIKGAVLLERLSPGTSLAQMALKGRDEEATTILAEVIQKMSPSADLPQGIPTVQDWGRGFSSYLASGDRQIPVGLVEEAQRIYVDLCDSQGDTRLLHGDLQHYNVLLDSEVGWIAIDPKGVIGEVEYEVGASLRNPIENPKSFASARTIRQRLRKYVATLDLDAGRALAWGFSQAVLSAIWAVEDGFQVDSSDPSIMLAVATRPMLLTSS